MMDAGSDPRRAACPGLFPAIRSGNGVALATFLGYLFVLAPMLGLVALLSLAFPAGPAVAQSASGAELQALINRVERLQRELDTLQSHVYRGQASPPTRGPAATAPGGPVAGAAAAPAVGAASGADVDRNLTAIMHSRMDDLDLQVRLITGRQEELDHAISRIGDRLDRLVADIDFRLTQLESRPVGPVPGQDGPMAGVRSPSAAPPPGAGLDSAAPGEGVLGTISPRDLQRLEQPRPAETGPVGTSPGTAREHGAEPGAESVAALPPGTPKERYDHATGLLALADFAGAEQAFRAFLEAHGDHALAGNAQYWLGETFYVRRDFEAAARAFAEGYQRFPDSDKSPDNLLKLAMSLRELSRPEQACATLDRLRSEFPDVRVGIRDVADRQRQALRCP